MLAHLIVALFGLWFAVSLLNQLDATGNVAIKRWVSVVKMFDLFSLVPTWNFFAPNPGVTDYHLLYRECLEDGSCGIWRELPFPKETGLLKLLWNPRKRASKVISDVVVSLGGAVAEARQVALERVGPAPTEDDAVASYRAELMREISSELADLKLSIPYLVILSYVSALPHSPFGRSVQFLFAQTAGFEPDAEPEILYVSEPHELAG